MNPGDNRPRHEYPLVSGTIACAEVDAMSDMTYDPVSQGIVA
jgi:hypothetical protein